MIDNHAQNRTKYKIGITCWSARLDEIGYSISKTLKEMGHKVQIVPYGEKIPEIDLLLTYGPFGHLTPITNQLVAMKWNQQPVFILWLTEQFPNPTLPEWFRYPVSILRSEIERAGYTSKNGFDWQMKPGTQWILNKGSRFRYYGEIHWLKRSGIRTVLVTPSNWTADFLRQRDFNPVVACIRTKPIRISESDINRDIPVLWLGKIGSKRRNRLLQQIRNELSASGIEMMFIDGVENPYVFGKDRTKLLNRTNIVLNILRAPWDDNTLRFFFAAENHVLIISEPSLPHSPFIPGIHFIEVPVHKMSESISYYLSNDKERKRITDSAKHLVTNELTLENSLSKILNRVEKLYDGKEMDY